MGLELKSVLLGQYPRALNSGMEAARGDPAILTDLFDEFRQIVDLGNRNRVQFGTVLLSDGECDVERLECLARAVIGVKDFRKHGLIPPLLAIAVAAIRMLRRGALRQQVAGKIEGIGDHRRNHGARNYGCDKRRILRLVDDAMWKTEEGRNGPEGQPSGHQQSRLGRLFLRRLEVSRHWIDADDLRANLRQDKDGEGGRRRDQRGNRHKGSRPDEKEWRQKPEGKRPQPADQRVVLADGSGERHANEIGGKNGLAIGPARERSHAKQAQEKELGFELRGAAAIELEEAWR